MWVYYLIYGVSLLAVAATRNSARSQRVAYWGLLLGYFIFSGFRHEVGCDWRGYRIHFFLDGPTRNYAEILSGRELGYWSLVRFLIDNGYNYLWLNVVTSALFFAGLHTLARRQTNALAFLVMSFPILVINMPMSGIRQGAAIGFLCMAFVAFSNRNLLMYVACVVLGSLVHSSAIVFLLLAPFVAGDYSKGNVAFATLLAIPGAYFLSGDEAIELAASRYVGTGLEAAGAAARLGVLAVSGLAFMMFADRLWKQHFPRDYKLVKLGAMMMVAAMALLPISSVGSDRLGYYLIPIQLMMFSRVSYLNLRASQSWVRSAPYVLLTLVFVVWTQYSYLFELCYIPYQIRFQ